MFTLLIVGSSKGWKEDLINALELVEDFDVCCVNASIHYVPCILLAWPKYHYSYHLRWKALFDEGKSPVRLTSCQPEDTVLHKQLLDLKGKDDWGGSSGLQATKIAIKYWGYSKIILCGIALSPPYEKIFYRAWPRAFPIIKDRVRSMSGKTKELLGQPSKEWLNANK